LSCRCVDRKVRRRLGAGTGGELEGVPRPHQRPVRAALIAENAKFAKFAKIILSYFSALFSKLKLGLLINFNEHSLKHRIKRVVNGFPE
jgi:hypothetical protein